MYLPIFDGMYVCKFVWMYFFYSLELSNFDKSFKINFMHISRSRSSLDLVHSKQGQGYANATIYISFFLN